MDYRLLFEEGARAMLVVTADGDVLDANQEARRIIRKRLEDMKAAGRDGIFDPADPATRVAFEKLRRTGEFRGTLRLLRWYGVPFRAEVSMAAFGQGLVSVVFGDLTGDETEGRFGQLVQSLPDVVMVADPDGKLRYVNPAVERVLGYRPEEFLGIASDLVDLAKKIIHPEDHYLAMSELAEAQGESGTRRPAPLRARHKDGSWRYVEGHIDNLSDDPDVEGLMFVSRDVTERMRAEEELRHLKERLETVVEERTALLRSTVAELEENAWRLRESEERFRTTFDLAAVGIAHVRTDGRWLRFNKRLCEIVGYCREELLGLTFQQITHPEDLDADLDRLQLLLSGEIEKYSMDKRYLRQDGCQVWVSLAVSLVRGSDGAPDYLISIVEDITERRRADLLLRSLTSREREVLGLLARGLTNQEIAQSMHFSVGTVKVHVQRVIAKLGVSGRAQAAVRAVELGLAEPER